MDIQQLLSQAEQIEKQRQWAQAAELYRTVLENSSNNQTAKEKLGWCLSRAREYEQAIAVFQDLAKIQPQVAKWPYMIGYQYYDRQQWRESIEWFSKSLSLNSGYITVLYRKGYAHFKLGHVGESLKAFERCRSLWHALSEGMLKEKDKKNCAKAAYYQAQVVIKYPREIQGGIETAVPLITEAIKLEPKNHNCHYALGKVLLEIGQAEKAIAAFQESDRLSPNQDYVLDRWGRALAKLNRLEEAEEIYQRILLKRPKDYVLRNLGKVQHQRKDYQCAIETFKKAIQKNSRNHFGHYYLGLCYQDIGEWALAVRELREAIHLKEKYYKGSFTEAEKELNEILSRHPEVATTSIVHTTQRGKIAKYFDDKGYGFIKGKSPKQIFFHISDCRRHDKMEINIWVEYEESIDDEGRPKAIKVRRVDSDKHKTP